MLDMEMEIHLNPNCCFGSQPGTKPSQSSGLSVAAQYHHEAFQFLKEHIS